MNYKNAYTYEEDRLKTVLHNTTGDMADVTYTFDYDDLGRKTTVKVGTQTLSTNVYEDNRNGLLSEAQFGNGGKVKYSYDEFDRVTGLRYDGESSDRYAYEYGANGAAARVTDNHLGRAFESEYDLADRPCRSTLRDAGTGEKLYQATLKYDKLSNLEQFVEAVGTDQYQTSYAYDRDNRATQVRFGADTRKVDYGYDALGRIASRTVTNGTSGYASAYTFVAGGYGANSTTALVSEIAQGTGDNAMNFAYAYDTRGNITSETRNDKITSYSYDALGQLIRVNDPNDTTSGATGTTWAYTYDRGGNILRKERYAYTTGALGTALEIIPYSYTDGNWKDKLTSFHGRPITYDAIGNPLRYDGMTFEWQAGRQLQKISMRANANTGAEAQEGVDEATGTILRIEFSNGNQIAGGVTSTTATAKVYSGTTDVTASYAASAFHWTRNSDSATADATWNNAHTGRKSVTLTASDLNGSCTFSCTLAGQAQTFGTVNVSNDLVASHTPSAADASDTFSLTDGTLKVTTTSANPYSLADGDLKANADLASAITASAMVYNTVPEKVVEFAYDHNGLRTQKKVTENGVTTTTNYTLHGKLLTHLTRGTDAMHFFYDAQSRPAMVEFNGALYTYVHNLQGDISSIVDNSGSIVVEYGYDAWGNPTSTRILKTECAALAELNPFRYRGYVWDQETGLYYLKTRYYNPLWGRFINADCYPGKFGQKYPHNLFAYGFNDFINVKDENGLAAIGVAASAGMSIGAFIGSVVSATITGLTIAVGAAVVGLTSILPTMPTPVQVRSQAGIAGEMDAAMIQSKLLAATISNASVRAEIEQTSEEDYYYISFVKSGLLFTIDLPLTFDEAQIALTSTGIMNALYKKHNVKKTLWGIYTPKVESAYRLYSAFGGLASIEEYEFHLSTERLGDYYFHYHIDVNNRHHAFHIWFGIPTKNY